MNTPGPVDTGNLQQSGPIGVGQFSEPPSALDIVKLTMPIRWVVGVVMAVAAGVLSVGAVFWRTEAHIGNESVHVSSQIAQEGGPVSARRLRRVLRTMTIRCEGTAGTGLVCRVELPEEAD